MLAEPTSEDEDNDDSNDDSSDNSHPLGANILLLGMRGTSHPLSSYHPTLPQSVALFRVFSENVLPVVHIFHMPTTTRTYWDAVGSLDTIGRNHEALLFSIYYSAVTSLEDSEACTALLGMSRKSALKKYRNATEQALARADLLNTHSIILLQAAVLYITVMRHEDDSRTPWALTSLICRIGQAMGLHRDGTAFGLPPLATEVRRRLWYHICLLDCRAAEYHGHEPVVAHDGRAYDTRPPLLVDDADLTADMAAPPPERLDRPCDMTFCRIRSEVMRVGWQIGYAPPWAAAGGGRGGSGGGSLAERQALVADLGTRLQDQHLRHCEGTNVPFHRVILAVTRLMLARTWLSVTYPFALGDRGRSNSGSGATSAPDDAGGGGALRDQLFLKSIEVIEQSAMLTSARDLARWSWHSRTHIQWHAVALVLSEICARPPGPDCDRAWGYACAIYDSWRVKDNNRNGTMWRPIGPIRRLMAKARYVRVTQRVDAQIFGHGPLDPLGDSNLSGAATLTVPSVPQGGTDTASNPPVASSAAPGPPYAASAGNLHGVPEASGTQSSDPFAGLFPDGFQADTFSNTLMELDSGFNPAAMVDGWSMQYAEWVNIG